MTTSSNNTNDENGLYQSTETNTGQPTYYFRGNVENNYVSFAGFIWRIVRINEDGTIRLIMQNSINNNQSYPFNPDFKNISYMYYSNSDVENGAKRVLDNWYQTNIASKKYSSYVAKGNYFCEQAKVAISTLAADNSGANMKLYTEYKPDFKCSADKNGKGIVNSNVGLLSYDEAVFAGAYVGLENNCYLSEIASSFRTMSPGGMNGNDANVWFLSRAVLTYTAVYDSLTVHPAINLNVNTKAVGLGTSDKPFIVE